MLKINTLLVIFVPRCIFFIKKEVLFNISYNNYIEGNKKGRYMKNIRKYIYIITIIIFIIFCIMVIIRKRELKDNNINYTVNKENIIVNNDKINDEEEYIYVDIKGEVINPNVYKIKKGLRVIDVINLAGGLTEESDTSNINLSKIATDEMVIVIKSKNNEEVYIDSDVDINNNNNNNNQLIDINTCTIDELLTLPGIGESKANNIIEYRKKNKFNTINDIMNVSGISESLFNKIKEYIKV